MNKLLQKVYGTSSTTFFKQDSCLKIEVFEPFMLTEKRMMDAIMRSDKKTCNNTKVFVNKNSNEYFIPREKDTLFWCFFIMKYGKESYNDLGKINIVIERKWKIDYIERLRKNKESIKRHKIAPLTHVENFLINEQKIDIKTFI